MIVLKIGISSRQGTYFPDHFPNKWYSYVYTDMDTMEIRFHLATGRWIALHRNMDSYFNKLFFLSNGIITNNYIEKGR